MLWPSALPSNASEHATHRHSTHVGLGQIGPEARPIAKSWTPRSVPIRVLAPCNTQHLSISGGAQTRYGQLVGLDPAASGHSSAGIQFSDRNNLLGGMHVN